MFSIVQLCQVLYSVLLCILQSKHCRVPLHQSVASHNYLQIHIWRRDLVTFVCVCEHHGQRRYQIVERLEVPKYKASASLTQRKSV